MGIVETISADIVVHASIFPIPQFASLHIPIRLHTKNDRNQREHSVKEQLLPLLREITIVFRASILFAE